MIIEGGTGNGYKAKVNDKNHLMVRAISESAEHDTNLRVGRAFTICFNQSPTAGDDCIFYLKNTDTDRNLVVEGLCLGFINATAVDPTVYFKLGDQGTADSPTTVTPVNLNTSSAYTLNATCQKGADLDAGSAISGGTEFARFVFAGSAGQDVSSSYMNFPMDIILGPNGSLSMWASDAGATYYVNFPVWAHSIDS